MSDLIQKGTSFLLSPRSPSVADDVTFPMAAAWLTLHRGEKRANYINLGLLLRLGLVSGPGLWLGIVLDKFFYRLSNGHCRGNVR